MSLEPAVGSEVINDSRHLRIHKWISTLPPTDFAIHQRPSSIARADSPLLGFTSQENASHDPLHRPSPNYFRRLPEGVLPDNEDKSPLALLPDMRIPPAVPEDTEQEILLPSLMRNQPLSNQTRYLAHLSLLQPRPVLPRQPSLPVIRSSVPLSLPSRQAFDSVSLPRARSQSNVAPLRPAFTLSSQPTVKSPLSPTFETNESAPAAPASAENLNQDLERQKLNALVIASGLADEEELRTNGPVQESSPSQVYPEEPNRVVPVEVESSREADTENYASSVAAQGQFTTDSCSPRASSSFNDLDEFDDDASYYGKEMDPLFSPYSRSPSASKPISPVSKWSLSSSVEDLGGKSISASKSLKSKGEKIKSFISRLSSNNPPPSNDRPIFLPTVDEKVQAIRRQRSHSDVLESIAGRSSVSSQPLALAYGSWESVPPTPSTVLSTTSISISTSHSPVTPSDNEGDSNDHASSGRRYSDEKSPAGKTVAGDGESPVSLTRDTSSSSLTWPGTNTSVTHGGTSSITPLEHSISLANLKAHGLKGLVSKIGLSPAEGLHEEGSSGRKNPPKEEKPSAAVPRSFRERMMMKNNGSALSLILGKSGNKTAKQPKQKRKLLISGVEKGNYKKYEAISSWCEGFGEVKVDCRNNGIIVADFKDVNVADTVCRLQARVHIRGAGSVNLSWTTNEF